MILGNRLQKPLFIKNQNIYIKFEAIFYYIINGDDFNGT